MTQREHWEAVLRALENRPIRELLAQQARLRSLTEEMATVEVTRTWRPMVSKRRLLLEKAFQRAMGSPRIVVLVAMEEEVAR